MKLGIRTQLFGLSLLLTTSVVVVTGVYLERSLQGVVRHRFAEDMQREAQLARLALEHAPSPVAPAFYDRLADDIAERAGMDVQIFNDTGALLGDSRAEFPGLMSTRVELPQKLEHVTFVGSTFGVDVPWVQSGETVGYVRLTKSSSEIDDLLAQLRGFMVVAAAVAILAAGIMSLLASHLTSRTLRKLIDYAQQLARGTPEAELTSLSLASDLGGLATSINVLSAKLARSVDDLAFERDRFEAILQSMNEAVISLDDQHRIMMINRAGEEFFAPQLRTLDRDPVGARVTDILRVPALIDLLEHGRDREGLAAAELLLPGTVEKRVMAQVTPRPADTGSVLVMHDVTELRRLENVRRDFVANVSHELRTPVSVILAMSETLLGDDLQNPQRLRGFIEAMNRNADRLSDLISDLLDISRLESGKHRLELEPVSVFGVALHVIDHLSERAEKKDQTIDVDVDMELLVFADSKALDQILYNFVDNAIKYCDVGGEIVVRASPVDDENPTASSRRAVRIEVCDDGPGLAAKHRPRIFERFYRIDDGRSRDIGGTGLGLAIVKHLSAAMSGRVGVKPNDPRGSIFWVQLPEAQPEDETSVEIAQAMTID